MGGYKVHNSTTNLYILLLCIPSIEEIRAALNTMLSTYRQKIIFYRAYVTREARRVRKHLPLEFFWDYVDIHYFAFKK